MKKILFVFVLIVSVFGCSQKSGNAKILASHFIDSVIKNSDSSYEKPYFRTDFVTASYYVNKKDSTVCQLMKDSSGNIRQVIIAKKGIRLFFGLYYTNGQLQADLPLDAFGQYHGTGKFFYEDGKLQSTGNYTHGFKTGDWKVYDKKGTVTATDSYDSNGNLLPQKMP
ncbi:MAG: toxin-antitoxin system YwqK family antitoxin [Ferruginibacter sp.]